MYLIHVLLNNGQKWVVEKRYSQFRELRQELRRLNILSTTSSSALNAGASPVRPASPSPNKGLIGNEQQLEMPPFPKKKWFFNLSKSALKKRQTELSDFMAFLITFTPQPMEIG